jgi:hypothetical protein
MPVLGTNGFGNGMLNNKVTEMGKGAHSGISELYVWTMLVSILQTTLASSSVP